MRNLINSAAATAMCAMIAVSVAPTQAAAGVVGMGDQAKIGAASPVEQFTTDIIGTGIIITTIGIILTGAITITATITAITRIITILRRRWSELPRPWRPSRSGVGDILIIEAILDDGRPA